MTPIDQVALPAARLSHRNRGRDLRPFLHARTRGFERARRDGDDPDREPVAQQQDLRDRQGGPLLARRLLFTPLVALQQLISTNILTRLRLFTDDGRRRCATTEIFSTC